MMFVEEEEATSIRTRDELQVSDILASEKTQDSLETNISGFPWQVDFFNQILDNNDVPVKFDIKEAIALQKYRAIENLELRLLNPLSSLDMENAEAEAYVNIGSAVFEHDLFMATLKGGRLGLFTVEKSDNKTFDSSDVFKITFKLLAFSDTEKDMFVNVKNKVVSNYVYDEDYKNSNGSPIVLKQHMVDSVKVENNIKVYLTNYVSKFGKQANNLLVVNIDGRCVVDPFINDYIYKFFSDSDIHILKSLERFDDAEHRDNQMTLFNSLCGDLDLKFCKRLTYTKPYANIGYTMYSDVKVVVNTVDTLHGEAIKILDQDYFVDESFYTDVVESDSSFKKIVHSMINGDSILIKDLEDELTITATLEDKDYYFRMPILLSIYKLVGMRLKY